MTSTISAPAPMPFIDQYRMLDSDASFCHRIAAALADADAPDALLVYWSDEHEGTARQMEQLVEVTDLQELLDAGY